MRELIEQYYLPHKTGRKRMPVIYNAVGKRDLFSWHKRIYYVGRHNCIQKANWFAKNSFLYSFKEYQKFTDRFILSNTLTVPCGTHLHSGQTQKSTSPPVLRRFKLSKRLTRKYAKLQSIILRPKVTLMYATS